MFETSQGTLALAAISTPQFYNFDAGKVPAKKRKHLEYWFFLLRLKLPKTSICP